MYALKIAINDQPPIVAGADDLSGLHVFVSCSGETVHVKRWNLGYEPIPVFDLSISGLTSRASNIPDELLSWATVDALATGDVVTIEITETEHATPYSSARPAWTADQERAHFEHCKRTYFALRDQFETA